MLEQVRIICHNLHRQAYDAHCESHCCDSRTEKYLLLKIIQSQGEFLQVNLVELYLTFSLYSNMAGKRGRKSKDSTPRDHAKIVSDLVDPDVSDSDDTFSPPSELQSTVVNESDDSFALNNTHKRQKDEEGNAAMTSAQAKVSLTKTSCLAHQSNLSSSQRQYEMTQHANSAGFIHSPGHKRTAASLLDTGAVESTPVTAQHISPANLHAANPLAIGENMSKSLFLTFHGSNNSTSCFTDSVQRASALMRRRDQLRDQIAKMERAVEQFENGRDPSISMRELEETRRTLENVESELYAEVDNDIEGDIVDAVVTNDDPDHDETVELSDEDMETEEQTTDDASGLARDPRIQGGYPILAGSSFVQQNHMVFHSSNAPPLVPIQGPQIVMVRPRLPSVRMIAPPPAPIVAPQASPVVIHAAPVVVPAAPVIVQAAPVVQAAPIIAPVIPAAPRLFARLNDNRRIVYVESAYATQRIADALEEHQEILHDVMQPRSTTLSIGRLAPLFSAVIHPTEWPRCCFTAEEFATIKTSATAVVAAAAERRQPQVIGSNYVEFIRSYGTIQIFVMDNHMMNELITTINNLTVRERVFRGHRTSSYATYMVSRYHDQFYDGCFTVSTSGVMDSTGTIVARVGLIFAAAGVDSNNWLVLGEPRESGTAIDDSKLTIDLYAEAERRDEQGNLIGDFSRIAANIASTENGHSRTLDGEKFLIKLGTQRIDYNFNRKQLGGRIILVAPQPVIASWIRLGFKYTSSGDVLKREDKEKVDLIKEESAKRRRFK